MAEEKQKLSIEEQESIAKAVLQLVASYDGFPPIISDKKIHIDDLKDDEGIGIFPTAGAVVLRKYVSGSFEAQFPFMLNYKCSPTTNAAFIAKREILDGLAKWLEHTEYPLLSDGRRIENITRITTTALAGKTESGASILQCSCILKYIKKG